MFLLNQIFMMCLPFPNILVDDQHKECTYMPDQSSFSSVTNSCKYEFIVNFGSLGPGISAITIMFSYMAPTDNLRV